MVGRGWTEGGEEIAVATASDRIIVDIWVQNLYGDEGL